MKYHVINVKKKLLGETGRTLSKRIKEHKYAVCSMNMINTIARHSCSMGHRANWEGLTVIGLGEHPIKRKILEGKYRQHEFG